METKQAAEIQPVMVGVAGKQDLKYQEFVRKLDPEQLELIQDVTGKDKRRPSTAGTTLQAYTDKHRDQLEEMKALVASPDWIFKKSQDGVDVFTMKVEGEPLASYKAVTTVKTHGKGIQHIFLGLLQVQDRPKWDEMCVMGEMLECYLPFYRVSYYQMKTPIPGIVCHRDVLVIVRPFFEEDGSIIAVATNHESDSRPEQPPFVRVKPFNAYIIEPTEDPDEFQVTVAGTVDLCGWLPEVLKNATMWKQGLTLAKLKKYLLQDEEESEEEEESGEEDEEEEESGEEEK